jgi:Mrp family chromosome partitioning ATPase
MSCPGPASSEAGNASSCAGCPSQSICTSLNKGPKLEELQGAVRENLRDVKRIVIVLSGKGGVGKSTFTCSLAQEVSSRGFQVGVLDADICGPSTSCIFGLFGQKMQECGYSWSPVASSGDILVASSSLLADPENVHPMAKRTTSKNSLIQLLLERTFWGSLDYLFIDTPPGTSDEHLSLCSLLKGLTITSILITTPQELSFQDVRKEVDFCQKANLPILCMICNMSGFVCPCCGNVESCLPSTVEVIRSVCLNEVKCPLFEVPFDIDLGKQCDEGFLSVSVIHTQRVANLLSHSD